MENQEHQKLMEKYIQITENVKQALAEFYVEACKKLESSEIVSKELSDKAKILSERLSTGDLSTPLF